MNALTKIESTALSAMTEQELVEVLQVSLYPGAKLESIKMVLGYCKAAGLDPMQKPVHIVPMKVSTGEKDDRGWDIKADRDVIMPGVGLYRTQAARSGAYAGVSDPDFGPTRQLTFASERWEEGENGRRQKRTTQDSIEYPEWCRVSVTRVVDGTPCEFSAREYWLENYATKGSNSTEPNAMWKKRPFGQIAKCAEAQALRKAFPEMTGSQPTAEEMEGKSFDEAPSGGAPPPTVKHMGAAEVVEQQAEAAAGDKRPPFAQATFDECLPVWRKAAAKLPVAEVLSRAEAANPTFAFTEQQKATILSLKNTPPAGVTFAQVADAIAKAKDVDALATAGDLIRQISDEQQRSELQGKYDEREAALKVGA